VENLASSICPYKLVYLFESPQTTADEEECKVGLIAEEVSKKQKDCEEDLAKAEPALTAAQQALNTLNKVM
jgi:dynein heavy chain